jgi:Zn-dependent M32 family carboxypeptidase
MQNLEQRKDKLFKILKEIKQEKLFNSLEKIIYEFVEYSNPALKYVKTIKEKFDVNLLISEQGFSMQNIKNMQGELADEDSFESLLNDLN